MEKGSLYRLYTKAKYEFGKSISGEAKIMKGVEILRTGEFKGYVWDVKKMKKAVSNFRKLKKNNIFPDVPIRINHGGIFGGGVESVCGYINDLHVKLLDKKSEEAIMTADCEFIDQEVIDDIDSAQKNERRGKFIKRSIEFGPYVDNNNNEYDPVIYGYAFVDIPAVEELKPLPAFAFSKFINNKKVVELNKEEFMPEEKENIQNDEEEVEEETKKEEEVEPTQPELTDEEDKEETKDEEEAEEKDDEENTEENEEKEDDKEDGETEEEDKKEEDEKEDDDAEKEENKEEEPETEDKEDETEKPDEEEKEEEVKDGDSLRKEDSHKLANKAQVEILNSRLELVNSYLQSSKVKTTPAMAEFEMTIMSLIPVEKQEEAIEAYKKLKDATPALIVLDKTDSQADVNEPDKNTPGEVTDEAAQQKAQQVLKSAGFKVTKVEDK